MLTATHSATMLLLSGAVIGLGYGSLVPCLQTLAIQHSPAHRTGYATATFFTLYDTGIIAAGSFVFGLLVSFTDFSKCTSPHCGYCGLTEYGRFLLERTKTSGSKKHKRSPFQSKKGTILNFAGNMLKYRIFQIEHTGFVEKK
ncbi:hypothetical protein BsIDN1_64340 [Bacillus safensis]|uniref:Major facilitator superfamily (MFS) profile domain-containing protein n=1 Tax=Bacillus safensis TaxID=561879 RepID=A0A5S9MMC0_BACIA|nr:hypothetical protein BsIDN1_64340 [Bacillus safensis]